MADFFGVNYDDARAQDLIGAVLRQYGLDDPGLIQNVYNVGKNQGDDAAYLFLREQPKYRERFSGMELRRQKGLSPMTEQQYIQWESAFTSVMRNNGIPATFYDSPSDLAQFIGNDIDPEEVQSRVVKGVVAARQAPAEVKQALLDFYGIDEGHLAAYWLDPSPERGEKLLREQAATYVGGAATRARFAGLTRQEAEKVAAYGQSPEEVEQNFAALTQGRELLGGLPGQAGEEAVSREQQIQYAAGSADAQSELARRAQRRKAQFAGGGGAVEGQTGVAGLAQSP